MPWIHELQTWIVSWAQTDNALVALFFLAFAESSFFPLPPDILLIAMSLNAPSQALYYALLCTVGSAAGGVFGYFLGQKGGRPLLNRFVSAGKIRMVHDYFEKYEAWAIGIAGFTPIPYKIFTLSAGVFYIDFLKFVLVSFISRGARFFLVAGMIVLFGDYITGFIEKYFNLLSILFVILLIGGFYVVKKMSSRAVSQKDEA
ncbi:MAG: DedA family protein [Deltaproteobacteria bacterium]|nr:DedA family protein [Deltaproteobacteria bacterium]